MIFLSRQWPMAGFFYARYFSSAENPPCSHCPRRVLLFFCSFASFSCRIRAFCAGMALGAKPLYHIAQECLRNVSKHAKAEVVSVSIELIDKVLRLTVKDSGIGLAETQAGPKS